MKTNEVTFGRFSDALIELGFTVQHADMDGRPCIVFRHRETDTLVVLPPLKPSQRVPIGELISARFLFPARGVTTEEHLEELLTGRSTSNA
jgi:hypothetical protein